jgi:hypothetical protein
MSDCCNCSTTWTIEETHWSVYSYGLNNGGQYLGPKLNLVNPNSPPVGCTAGSWDFLGEKKNRIFYKRVERLFDRKVKRILTSGPTSNGDCINTTGGKLIKKTLINEDNQDYGLENKITNVTNDYNLGSYWKYSTCNTISIGYEEFKYRKEVYKSVYQKIYQADHKCGGDRCCTANSNVPDLFDKEQEYENWVNKL